MRLSSAAMEIDDSVRAAPNADIIRFWNEIGAQKFIRFRQTIVRSVRLHSDFALEHAHLRPGDAVLDVGCGFGDLDAQLAERVGEHGRVLGIDCAREFIEIAEREFALPNVRFLVADAQTFAPRETYDVVVSRFGTMFFQNPVLALRNLRRALKPGGRLVMAVWRSLAENEWAALPKGVALAHLPPDAPPVESCGPGPFSMASENVVRDILHGAGFQDVALERCDADYALGTVDEAVAFSLAIGPTGEIVREAGERGRAKLPGLEAALRQAFTERSRSGTVVLGASSWTVTAVNSGG
jgi:SAM-dependent methyltransferase